MALRRAAFNLLLFGCRNSGAAFIKWGQWASSRPDLLPEVPPSPPGCATKSGLYDSGGLSSVPGGSVDHEGAVIKRDWEEK